MMKKSRRRRRFDLLNHAFNYSRSFSLAEGQLVRTVAQVGNYIFFNGRWQRVMDVQLDPVGGRYLTTEDGEKMSLEQKPPDDFLYKVPTTLPTSMLTVASVILAGLGLIAAVVAAVASVMALFR